MRTDDHQVRAYVKFVVRRTAARCFHPGADIHIRDSDAVDPQLSAGKAILDPAQEDAIEAAGLVVRIAGNGRKTRPFAGAFAKHAIFAAGRGATLCTRGPGRYPRLSSGRARRSSF